MGKVEPGRWALWLGWGAPSSEAPTPTPWYVIPRERLTQAPDGVLVLGVQMETHLPTASLLWGPLQLGAQSTPD